MLVSIRRFTAAAARSIPNVTPASSAAVSDSLNTLFRDGKDGAYPSFPSQQGGETSGLQCGELARGRLQIKFTDSEQDRSQSYISEIQGYSRNIENHVRDSFKKPKSVESIQGPHTVHDKKYQLALNEDGTTTYTGNSKITSLVVQAKKTTVALGIAPNKWKSDLMVYDKNSIYGGQLEVVGPQSLTQTAAYHYTRELVPKDIASRFPIDMLVDPVYATSDRDLRIRMNSHSLWPRLQDRVTILVVFSGQPLSGLQTGLEMWRRIFKDLDKVENRTETRTMGGGSAFSVNEADQTLRESMNNKSLPSRNLTEAFQSSSNIYSRFSSSMSHLVAAINSSTGKTSNITSGFGRTKLQSQNSGLDDYNLRNNSSKKKKPTQFLRLHCSEGWFSRRTHVLTKYLLRKQVKDDELWDTFVYRGKWTSEIIHKLHLYNGDLPTCLLIDKKGYIRWHAIGLPNEESIDVFKKVYRKLKHEKF